LDGTPAALAWGSAIVFDLGKVELAKSAIDIDTDHIAIGIKVDVEPFDDLARLD